MKNLCLLGSTGSIGKQTIDIIKRHGGFKITSLAVKSKIDILISYADNYKTNQNTQRDDWDRDIFFSTVFADLTLNATSSDEIY